MADHFDQLLTELDNAVKAFQKVVPSIQKDLLNQINTELSALDLKSGNVVVNAKNVRLISKIKSQIMKAILSDDYKSAVKEYLKTFDTATKLQNQYFKSLEKKFTPSKLGAEIKKQSVDAVVENLTERGIDANVVAGVEDILKQSITTGGSIADLQNRLRNNIVSNETGVGALERYTQQITTDALHQYSAQYTQTVSSDLGFVWFRYQNSLIETSREFCVACRKKDFIHISEFDDVVHGRFPEFDDAGGKIYAKTGLPEGMVADTNAATFPVLRGGYNCGHQLRPVRASSVPAHLRAQFETVKPTQADPVPEPQPAATPAPVKAKKKKKGEIETPVTIDLKRPTFKPAKTTADAHKFIADKHGLTYGTPPANATALSLDVANLVNKELDFLLSNYDLPEHVTFEKLNVFNNKSDGANAKVITNIANGNSEMKFNDRFNDGAEYEKMKERSVANKWSPEGSTTREATVHHEFAHTLTAADIWRSTKKYDVFRPNGEVAPIVDELKKVQSAYNSARRKFALERAKVPLNERDKFPKWSESADFISEYGEYKNDLHEFVAEGFNASINSKKPSIYALQIRAIIDKYYHKDRPKT